MSDGNVVIGLVGEMGAGKGTAAAYLKERYGAGTVRFSGMLRDVLGRLYLPDSRENLQTLSLLLRRGFGEDVMAKTIAEDARRAAAALVVADGVRRPDDIAYLKSSGNFFLAALETEARTRYERIRARGENSDDAAKTWEEFVAQGNEEPEQKIRALAAGADFHIDNNGSIAELHRQLDDIMRARGIKPLANR
ncbi:MAG: AAA family ATPase [Candidatus Jorgensenbacteria bacterium]